jgi:uncharacterized protein
MNGQLLLHLGSLGQPGAGRSFQGQLTVTDGSVPDRGPMTVFVNGRVYNEAGVLRCSARAAAELNPFCDRCGASYTLPVEIQFERVLSDTDSPDDDVLMINGDTVVLDQPLTEAFLLELPSYGLCRDDCEGLCHRCGQNLNDSLCNCEL